MTFWAILENIVIELKTSALDKFGKELGDFFNQGSGHTAQKGPLLQYFMSYLKYL